MLTNHGDVPGGGEGEEGLLYGDLAAVDPAGGEAGHGGHQAVRPAAVVDGEVGQGEDAGQLVSLPRQVTPDLSVVLHSAVSLLCRAE